MTMLDLVAVSFWRWILPAAVQAAPLLLIAAAFDLLLPRLASPRGRAGLYLVAAGKLVVPFAIWKSWGLIPEMDLPQPLPAVPLPSWAWWIPCLWLAGAVVLCAGSWLWLRREVGRWKAEAVPGDRGRLDLVAKRMGVAAPRLVATAALRGPVITGLVRPVLFWPAGLEKFLDEEECDQAMRHELAHVRRKDGWRDLAWSLLLAAFWFHPLVWWAVRRMRAIREQCCDRTASRLPGHCAASYRTALLRVLGRMEGAPASPGLALIDPRAPLAHRLALIAEPAAPRRRAAGVLAFGALLLIWPLAGWAERGSAAVAEWIERPPGSLQLRYIVLERLAQENLK